MIITNLEQTHTSKNSADFIPHILLLLFLILETRINYIHIRRLIDVAEEEMAVSRGGWLNFPDKIILEIIPYFRNTTRWDTAHDTDYEATLHALTLVNRHLHRIVGPLLYQYDDERITDAAEIKDEEEDPYSSDRYERSIASSDTCLHDSSWPRDEDEDLGMKGSCIKWAVKKGRMGTLENVIRYTPHVCKLKHVGLAIESGHSAFARRLLRMPRISKRLIALNRNIAHRTTHAQYHDHEEGDTELLRVYDEKEQHPIWAAVVSGDLNLVERVLQKTCAHFFKSLGARFQLDPLKNSLLSAEMSPLNYACQHGHLDIVRYLLECEANMYQDDLAIIDEMREQGNAKMLTRHRSALSCALEARHVHIFKYLTERQPDLLQSPLHFCRALEWGIDDVTGPFFDAGADVNPSERMCQLIDGYDNDRQGTKGHRDRLVPLFFAIASGNAALVQRMLDMGARVETIWPGTPGARNYRPVWPMRIVVRHAANEGSAAIAQMLIDHGACINIPEGTFSPPFYLTLLEAAVRTSNTALVEVLLQHIPLRGNISSLGWARSEAMMQLLLRYGASLEEPDSSGVLPLTFFILHAFLSVVDLHHHRAEVTRQQCPGDDLVGAFRFLASHVSREQLNAKEPMYPTDEAPRGDTPLILCCNTWNTYVREDKESSTGQDTDAWDKEQEKTSLARFLLDQGADPRIAGWQEGTALHKAVAWGNIPLVEMLLTRDPELVHVPNVDGDTPLIMVAHGMSRQSLNMARLLLKWGARLNDVNNDNRTALDLTFFGHASYDVESKQMKMAMLLEEHGGLREQSFRGL